MSGRHKRAGRKGRTERRNEKAKCQNDKRCESKMKVGCTQAERKPQRSWVVRQRKQGDR